ncbi:hypothetical protein B0J13DRAFT_616343 [Dactylonectria estremocensis]|uniref:Transcription factor domain-containing protein n=1 Tax=Dactylonectria estremocensis TaxID=1079267 RepID=A0A9P9FEL0_9HYPO|nr:hypothetical protein B0J13DRAFT_616343 [Dactylonectria estremocensis]
MEIGNSRKRLRRSRKRKVKCQLTEEHVETCAECVKSGTRCTLQALDSEQSSGNSPLLVDKQGGGNQEHELRLERIEALLKKLVEAQEGSRPPAESSSESDPAVSASIWDDILFDPTVDGTLPLIEDHTAVIPPALDTLDPKQSLVALLPSAQDAVTIVTNTTAWLWGAENPHGSVLQPNDTIQLLETSAIPRGSAMHVAKALLMYALYMQQLPASFDVQFLEFQSVERSIELIVERVKVFVLSHEDDACSIEGLECLTLLYLIQINDGAIRKAWMTFRRVLDIARLKGLQHSFSISGRESTCSDVALHRRLWLSAVCGDCYCSLLLGLEPGLGVAPFGPDDDWRDLLADDDANVQRRICLIVARIAQRNAVGLHKDRSILQEIDATLDKLHDSLPSSWWKAPSFRQDRSLDSAKEPNRIICQLWYFQARIYAHMPFAFGNPTDKSLRSLESCMDACRLTLQRYLGVQHAKDQLSRCRTIDQSVVVAAVILMLAKIQFRRHKSQSTSSRYDSDRALLDQVIDSYDTAGKMCRRERTARRSAKILSALLDMITAASEDATLVEGDSGSSTDVALDLETPLDSGIAIGGPSGTIKYGMEDIIMSSIKPLLDGQSIALRLINQLFANKHSSSRAPDSPQDLVCGGTVLNLDDLMDGNII